MKYFRFVAFLACTLLHSSTAHAAEIRTVALSGQQAPGTPSGVNFLGFPAPVLNDAGQTAFLAILGGSGVDATNREGIWSEGSGSLAVVARSGSPAPGTPSGVNYSRFVILPVLNDAGQTAFLTSLTGSGVDSTNNSGIWSEGTGSLALVARNGSQAPGTPSGVNFSSVSYPALNDAGQTAFYARLTGTGVVGSNDDGIWSEGSGSLALVARGGDLAPGTPSGVNYLVFFGPPALNDAGQIAFRAFLTGSGVDSTNNDGIWSDRSGSLALVAREGDHAPGTPSGVNYSGFTLTSNQPVLNDAGQIAFRAFLTGSGVDSTNNDGIWSDRSGSLALVARSGDQAPGLPSGVNYSGISPPVLNNSGQTAFSGMLTGSGVDSTNDSGIWSEGSGSLALVARRGDQAPGVPSGVNFGSLSTRPLVLNDAGQTAFYSFLTGSGVDSTNNQGIWATDRTGALQLIARTGDLLEVAPGDFRTISVLDFIANTGNSDGRPSGFNNLGQLAFRADFTGGTAGIFVSNRVAVPEPSTLLLLGFGSLAVLWRRRSLVCASILAVAVGITFADGAVAVTIDMVTVGNAGNAPDTRYNSISVGSVDHVYQTGKYEVTAGQYTEFLNAVADADPNGLYNTAMGDPSGSPSPFSGSLGANIQQAGSSPNFSYSVAADWANRPVNYVSFWDAARFANWLHNGQPTGAQGPGTTEDGAYHDVGNQALFGRNAGATYFVPSEDEWYKAAYHDKTAGLAASYFDYPSDTNSVPGNYISETTNPGNNANLFYFGFAIGSPYYRTLFGEFELSDSPYGTFDQGGNVFEWNETAVTSSTRSMRGGSFNVIPSLLRASFRNNDAPTGEYFSVGFRVASSIPEPSTLLLGAMAGMGLLCRRRVLG